MLVRVVLLASFARHLCDAGSRCPGRLCGRGRRFEGDGHGQPERDCFHRTRAYRRVRPEQEHWRPHGRRQRDERRRLQTSHQFFQAGHHDRASFARDRHELSAEGAGWSSADAGTVQPDDHSRAGRSQLGAGPEHLGDPVGFPESRGRQQSNGKPAGQPAGRLVFSCGLHVALRLELHSDRIHQQSESGHESRDARRSCGCRRPAGRVRVLGLPEHERPAGSDSRRAAAGGSGDIRCEHRVGYSEPADARRAARAVSRRRRTRARRCSASRRRRLSSASATGYSRSAETTSRWPSTWATTSSSSKADRAMRAGWR